MKDALGHGSGSRGGQYLKPNGRSIMPSRPAGAPVTRPATAAPAQPRVRTANLAHISDLRSPPKSGLLHSFTRGLKEALRSGASLHAKSLNGYDPRGTR